MPKRDESIDLDTLLAENESLKAAQAAQQAQNDQVLDALAELQEQLQEVKAGRMAPAATVPDKQAAMDAEWAALRAEFADIPNIDVLEHRILVGTDAPAALRLKAGLHGIPEPSVAEDPHAETTFWKLRWFNFAIEGRAEQFVQEGYQKVLREELLDAESIPNMHTDSPHVRKGERGLEVLGKIPRKVFEYKKRRDAMRSGHMMQSESALRDHVSNNVASMAGRTGGNADQAGSTVHGQFNVTITPQPTERVTA